MAISGLLITSPIIANDKLLSSSTIYTPFLQISKLSLTINKGSTTGYTCKYSYSIYDNMEMDLSLIQYTYTGITKTLTFDIPNTNVPDNGQIIQDCYKDVMNYFDNNGINYIIVGESHGLSEWYCFADDDVTYSIIDIGVSIYRKSISGKITLATSVNSTPYRGTFNIYSGYTYFGATYKTPTSHGDKKPINLVSEDSQCNIVPLSLNGNYFIDNANRYNPITYYIYSPYGDANVNFYENSSSGINGTITSSKLIEKGKQDTFTGDNLSYYYIESDIPVISSTMATGNNDMDILSPPNKISYHRMKQYPITIYGNTPSTNSYHVISDDDLCTNISIADGSGGDKIQGVGIEFISNTYSFGNTLSDFAIVAPYSATTISVEHWDDTNWEILESFNLNGELLTPEYIFRDGSTGTGATGSIISGLSSNFNSDTLWKFVGNYPFALIINDSSDNEMAVYGWMQREQICTGGLIHHYDATNILSFDPKNKWLWKDLIQSNNIVFNNSTMGITTIDEIVFASASTPNTYASLTSSITVDSSSGSFSIWIKSHGNYTDTNYHYGNRGMIMGENGDGTHKSLWFRDDGGDYRLEGETNTNGEYFSSTSYDVRKYNWVNIHINFDNNTGFTYINGVLKDQRVIVDNLTIEIFGGNTTSTQDRKQLLVGSISDIKFYNRQLRESEILQNYEVLKYRHSYVLKNYF